MSNETIRTAARAKVLAASKGRCAYCGKSLTITTATMDHLYPLVRGGTSRLSNLVAACASCNRLKGDLVLSDFRRTAIRFKLAEVPAFTAHQLQWLQAHHGLAIDPGPQPFYFEREGMILPIPDEDG